MATPTSHPRYDLDAWADDTDLGRRIFNYNYRMTGSEIRGWELVNSVAMDDQPDLTERVYLWEKKGSGGKQVIRIGITETGEWRRAHAELQNRLVYSMRPDMPHGKGKLASIGDVSFAVAPDDASGVATAYFARGNLSVTVASVGEEPTDVASVSKSLDRAFSEPPKRRDLEEERAIDRSPKPLKVEKHGRTRLMERLPAPVLRNGWLKVIVPDGEIVREGDELIYLSHKEGTKRIEEFVIIQEPSR